MITYIFDLFVLLLTLYIMVYRCQGNVLAVVGGGVVGG